MNNRLHFEKGKTIIMKKLTNFVSKMILSIISYTKIRLIEVLVWFRSHRIFLYYSLILKSAALRAFTIMGIVKLIFMKLDLEE